MAAPSHRCRLPVWSSPLGSVGRWVKCTKDDREGSGKECSTICKDLGPDPLLETLTLELGWTAHEYRGLFFTMSLPLVSSWQKGTEGRGRVMGFGKVWPRGGTWDFCCVTLVGTRRMGQEGKGHS